MYRFLALSVAIHATLTSSAQPGVPKPIPAPLRDLQFGEVNFLHTTDTHGWHAGHLLESSYSADWGDYIDFSDRLREKVEAAGQDLLVVDTGDRIEGNGLYDGDEPKGRHTFEIFTKQHIDLICIGNHELYKKNASENELNITVPAYHESYIASNLDIQNDNGDFVPLAQRYRKFTTKVQGLNIVAFGFIFNFQRADKNTKVIAVEEAIKQDWFQQAIREQDVDLFVVIGHAGIRSDEFQNIYKAIRSQNWDTPIQFFGGHLHIRDAYKYDSKAHALASGRFMETIGFQSLSGISRSDRPKTSSSTPTFFRRYIDSNLYSFYHHTGLNESTFHSEKGRNVSKMIQTARQDLKLDSVFGCAPQDYWMQRVPFPSRDSIFTLLNDTIIPEIVVQDDRKDKTRLLLVNTGAIRFDIFKGPFTKDSTFIVSPFTSGMRYLRDVPYPQAAQVLHIINRGGKPTANGVEKSDDDAFRSFDTNHMLAPPEQYSSHFVESARSNSVVQSTRSNVQAHLELHDATDPRLTIGYVTTDAIDSEGDDTIHAPMPFYFVPNVIQSLVPADRPRHLQDPEVVDLIFNEFLQPDVLTALRDLQEDYTNADVRSYMEGETMTDMISRWIAKNWGVYCDPGWEDEL